MINRVRARRASGANADWRTFQIIRRKPASFAAMPPIKSA